MASWNEKEDWSQSRLDQKGGLGRVGSKLGRYKALRLSGTL